jgi:Ca2+-binding EF-hand superfamily protein
MQQDQASSQGDGESEGEGSHPQPTPANTAPPQAYAGPTVFSPSAPGVANAAVDASILDPHHLTGRILVGSPNSFSKVASVTTAGLMVYSTASDEQGSLYAITGSLRIRVNQGETSGTFEQQINGEWVSTGITAEGVLHESLGLIGFEGVSEAEAQQLLRHNLFSQLDTDGDNQLNTQELKDGQATNLVGLNGHVLSGEQWDEPNASTEPTNISREDFTQNPEVFEAASKESFEAHNLFVQLDTDGDGQLSIEEIKSAQANNLLGFKGVMVPDHIWDAVGAQLAEKNIVISQAYFSQNSGTFKPASKEAFDVYNLTQKTLSEFDPGYQEEPLNPAAHPPLNATGQYRLYDGTVVFSEQEAMERGNLFNRLDTDADGKLGTQELLLGQQMHLIGLGGGLAQEGQWQDFVDQFGEMGITAETFFGSAHLFARPPEGEYLRFEALEGEHQRGGSGSG